MSKMFIKGSFTVGDPSKSNKKKLMNVTVWYILNVVVYNYVYMYFNISYCLG